jgi:hypothetical protein
MPSHAIMGGKRDPAFYDFKLEIFWAPSLFSIYVE